jgi:hypothetical protein
MTGINHALTGGVIAIAVGNPIIALLLAFASHFAMDALPHFGEEPGQRKKLSKSVWVIDGILVIAFISFLFITQQWLVLAGAFAAITPDFFWIYRLIFQEQFGKRPPRPNNWFNKFHSDIQKYERRWGLAVDVVWFVLFLSSLVPRI